MKFVICIYLHILISVCVDLGHVAGSVSCDIIMTDMSHSCFHLPSRHVFCLKCINSRTAINIYTLS